MCGCEHLVPGFFGCLSIVTIFWTVVNVSMGTKARVRTSAGSIMLGGGLGLGAPPSYAHMSHECYQEFMTTVAFAIASVHSYSCSSAGMIEK